MEKSKMQAPPPTESAAENNLSEQLKTLRVARGWSLRELARRAGVAQSSLTRWEQGRFAPRLPEMDAVLNALDASAEERRFALQRLERPRGHTQMAEEDAARSASGLSWNAMEWPAPSCGSLLRVIRLRGGKTLEEAAQAVGAQASTLSRWERGLAWPSQDTIQAIGGALGAHAEEQAALASGRWSLHASFERLHSLEALEHHFRARLEPLEMRAELNPGREMHFLQMEAALWPLARQSAEALTLLAEVYSHYGNYLSNFARWSEAKIYLNRALDLMPRHAHPEFLVMAAIRSTEMGAWSGGRFRPMQSIAMLDAWQKYAQGTRYQEFLMRKKVTYLALDGRIDHALECCQSALDLTTSREEPLYVRHELQRSQVWVLLRAGRFEQALNHVPETEPLPTASAIRDALFRAQALIGMNRRCEAHEWIGQAMAMAESLNLTHRRAEAMKIAKQL